MPLYSPQAPAGTHDCRFVYVDANTCRLDRYGGNKLMISGKLETIPAGGVTVAPYADLLNIEYVQCVALMQGSTMVLSWYNDAIAIDPYGMAVCQSHPEFTVVGMALGRHATFFDNEATCGAISYWNRRQRVVSTQWSQATASAAAVWMSNFYVQTLGFAGDSIRFMAAGYAYNDTAGARSYMDKRIKSPAGEPGADYGDHVYSAYANWTFNVGAHKDYVVPTTNWYGVSLWSSAPNGGTSTWVLNTSIFFEG